MVFALYIFITVNTTEKYWYPVKVKLNSEFDIFGKLLKEGYKTYMPMVRYIAKKNEKEMWKTKPIFRGKLFVYCEPDDILKLHSVDPGIKLYLKGKCPEIFSDKHISFLKKAFSMNEDAEVVNKIIQGNEYVSVVTEDFGEINFFQSEYREKECITWIIPVIKNTLIIDPDCTFIKYLIFESEEALA